MQCAIISCTQKVVIYETKARFFVVGSNNTETRFRVLKIDRTEPRELHLTDDKVEYSRKEIRDLLFMIDVGNRPKQQQKGHNGLKRTVSAFGLVGFVRFLEGYYVVLITKRRRVALIGQHTIYKIEDTSMMYIPNDTVKYTHPDEQRYVKMFQNVDLSSNFYFSYSYDVTRTLQYQLTPCKTLDQSFIVQSPEAKVKFWSTGNKDNRHVYNTPTTDENVEDASKTVQNFLESESASPEKDTKGVDGTPAAKTAADDADVVYGVKTDPTWKYIWNLHMLRGALSQLHPDWVLNIVHGFIGQSKIVVFGRPVYLTLLARRSNQFAGTRFLKRGANAQGYVANEVETEQIVHDCSVTDSSKCRFTSFVQLRGSIPLHWSQDISKMVPKPTIVLDQADPFGHLAGQHFNQVLRRYGAPIIILNLVKKRENKRHESILSDEFVCVLQYLNQFLPTEHAIKYIGFDMARVSKSKTENVLHRLTEIAEYCVQKTGFFQSSAALHCNEIRPHTRSKGLQSVVTEEGMKQHGVVRTNCVDCLDRTNTAQFAIGKCALAFQLHSLGILDCPYLEFETDCVRMLEELYEDQGDTLAVQYGGSQLVHRIKGYRKISPWTSSSRDIMHTLTRYYSNAFSDTDKQHAMNLFLGVFVPREGQPNVWELTTDFYLHHPVAMWGPKPRQRSYTQWWELPVVSSLPLAYEEESRGHGGQVLVIRTHRDDERVSGFWEYYKPFELTSLDELYCLNMPNSIRDFMPKAAPDYSPFTMRGRPGRRHEEYGHAAAEANPNISGRDSTSSVTGSEGSTSSSEGSDIEGDIEIMDESELAKEESGISLVSLKDLFPTMVQTYGVQIEEPQKHDVAAYKRFVQIGKNATAIITGDQAVASSKSTNLIRRSVFPMDSSASVEPPTVSQHSRDVYETYIKRGQLGASSPGHRDVQVYREYLSNMYL